MSSTHFDADQARHELYEVMKRDLPFEEKAERALAIGERYLGVDNGHVSKIDQQSDYWKAIASTDSSDGDFPPGLVLDLQTTYCRRTARAEGSIALHDAPNQGWADDPAFDTHGLYCYHGTPITIDDETYGIVCFVSEDSRGEPFTDDETTFAELVARLLEHELQRQRTEAKIDRLEQFASVVSHDLRNPLNVAQARVERERRNRDSEHLAVAAESLDRMENLVTDVLTMARQGRDVEETETVSLSSLVDRGWQSVETADAEVTVGDDLDFRADPERVQRLLENLFRNAVEHGGTDVSVRVGALADRDGFYVEDDGPGISQGERDQVFETGHSTTDGGVGLGLSIVEGIATAHEWEVRATESAQGGARFEVTDVIVGGAVESIA